MRDFLLKDQIDRALPVLRDFVYQQVAGKRTDADSLLGRFSDLENRIHQGLVTQDQQVVERNQLRRDILFFIAALEQADVEEAPSGPIRNPVHEYHAYTCDRVEQNDAFYRERTTHQDRVLHFYLYGGDLHEHDLFVTRLAYDLEGRLLDPGNPELPLCCRVEQVLPTTFEFSNDPARYRQNILRSLFSKLGLAPDPHAPLLEKNLNYLWEHSPRREGMTAGDYVCVLFKISDFDWDEELTPSSARWFIREFCGDTLPANAPTFLFFFSVEYDEEDVERSSEIREAVAESKNLISLPELHKVNQRDLGRWLERYEIVLPEGERPRAVLRATFGQAREHYMADIYPELKRLIDAYNNRLIV